MIVNIGEEQKDYLTNPIRFFGSAVILGIIGGLGMSGLDRYFNRKQRKDQDG